MSNATLKFDRPAAIKEKRQTQKDTQAARIETLRRKQVRRDKYTASR